MEDSKTGRFEAHAAPVAEENAAQAKKPAKKLHPATRCLIVHLFCCVIAGAAIALTYWTGDTSGRLALLLGGADLAVGAFKTGVWSQRIKGKGGAANG